MERDLTPLFFPKSVAVIGASARPDSLAGAVLKNLLAGGFSGNLAGVHPQPSADLGAPVFRSLDELPFVPDLVAWGVPFDAIDRDLPRLLDRGARAHLVLSAGFSEMGDEGAARERELVARVRAKNGVLLGPNCMGLHVARPGMRLDASFSRARPEPGPTALFVQSGSVGEWLLLRMNERRLGAAIAASLGNMGDLDCIDLLESVPRSFPEVRQVCLYLETVPEAARLHRALDLLPPHVRVLVLQGGRTSTGARAVLGHTGALAEEPALVAALFEKAGIQRVESLTEALDGLEVLQNMGVSRGRKTCVVTNAGGPGVLVTDALERAGFTLPRPSPSLATALGSHLSPAASIANPIDLLASATPLEFETTLGALTATTEFDVIVPVFMHPVTVDSREIATAIRNGLGSRGTDAVVCWMAGKEALEARDALRASGLAVLEEPDRIGRALDLWAHPSDRDHRPSPHSSPLEGRGSRLPRIEDHRLPGGIWGDPEALETALEGPLHRMPPRRRLKETNPSSSCAGEVGFPLYVKIESGSIPHKTASGLLARVEAPEKLEAALATLRARFPSEGRWLFQRAVRRGPEMYVGFLRHPRLGSFVGFGPGGREVEPGDITWVALPAPSGGIEAALLRSPASSWIGQGALSALASLVSTMADLDTHAPIVTMAEVNPAIWDAEGGVLWIVDARWQPVVSRA